MSKLVWDKTGEKYYETGTKMGVVYPQAASGDYPKGVPWNGLTGVTESPSGAEETALYANDSKYLGLMSTEEFGATVTAYTYPDEFAECDGSASLAPGVTIGQQTRKAFGLSYRTIVGNDVDNNEHGYKLHLIYGAKAAPSEKAYSTVNDSPEAVEFSWELTTTPVNVNGYKPTANLTIDSTKVDAGKLKQLEDILYGGDPVLTESEPEDWSTNYKNYLEKKGSEYIPVTGVSAPSWTASKYYKAGADARLPLPDEVAQIFAEDED